MENRLKRQRYWVLLSSKNIPVLGSLIARDKKPKSGEWKEVFINPCCSVKVAVGEYNNYPVFTITTSENKVLKVVLFDNPTIEDAINTLNQEYSALGEWSTDGTYFYLKGSPFKIKNFQLYYD